MGQVDPTDNTPAPGLHGKPALTSIGTLNEGSVHQALKARYAICGSDTEYEIDGFVVDIVLDGRIIEIQTSGFSTLKRKLPHLLERYRVTVVHPIAQNRYIVKVPDDPDQATTRRRSPKHGSLYDVFAELVSIPAMMEHPNMTLEVVLTQEDEIRVRDDQRGWRRGGWVVAGRRLLDITETHTIASMGELFERVDGNLPDEFTTNDLAAALASPLQLGQQAAYCFRHAGITDICGKTGNSLLYRRSTTAVG